MNLYSPTDITTTLLLTELAAAQDKRKTPSLSISFFSRIDRSTFSYRVCVFFLITSKESASGDLYSTCCSRFWMLDDNEQSRVPHFSLLISDAEKSMRKLWTRARFFVRSLIICSSTPRVGLFLDGTPSFIYILRDKQKLETIATVHCTFEIGKL